MKNSSILAHLMFMVKQALLTEVTLTPKPGLVDNVDKGSHDDMDLPLFKISISAITKSLCTCFYAGTTTAMQPPEQTLIAVREAGKICETAMLQATQGVNTHKGAIFAFGLLLAASGRIYTEQKKIIASSLCREVVKITAGITQRELINDNVLMTAGAKMYRQYGFSGARGEAESGFNTVLTIALPAYYQALRFGKRFALLKTLLYLIAENNDTNLFSRGGIEGVFFAQHYARQLLVHPAVLAGDLEQLIILMSQFNTEMIKRHLSPGGSADLLAVCYFLVQIDKAS